MTENTVQPAHVSRIFIGKVFATARNVDKMKGLRDTPNVELMALDVTSTENAANVVDHIANQEGRIDIVINNAGMACFGNVIHWRQPTTHVLNEVVCRADTGGSS